MSIKPAQVFHPGEYIADELDARGWDLAGMADITGIVPDTLAELIAGNARLTDDSAGLVATFFGQDTKTWINLQAAFDGGPGAG